MAEPAKPPGFTEAAQPTPDEATRPKLLPPYHLILANDDYHSSDFVVMVLCKALGFKPEKAFLLAMEAHESGRAILWTGPKEVGELKLEQVHTFHEQREGDGASLGPLECHLEPAV